MPIDLKSLGHNCRCEICQEEFGESPQLSLKQIEEEISNFLNWHINSFAVFKVTYSDELSYIRLDFPTDISDYFEQQCVVDKINKHLSEKFQCVVSV